MNLIEKFGHDKLLGDVTVAALQDVSEVLSSFIKESEGWGSKYTACQAYILGMKQGVHNERQRIKARHI